MKSSSILSLKSTFFVAVWLFGVISASAQSGKSFPQLPANFDAGFRFNNPLGLKGKIAFTAKIGDFERILVLDLDSKHIAKLIDGPGNNSFPAWSPGGDKIAFTSDRDGNKEIYLANADGSAPQRITTNPGMDDNVTWTPDGKALVFMGEHPGAPKLHTNIFSYSLADKKLNQITNFRGKNSTPDVSRDGKFVAYTTNRAWPGWDVCIFDLNTQKDNCALSGTSTYCRPAWAKTSSLLAYSAGLLGTIDAYIYNPQEKTSVDLASTSGNDYDLEWSADDKFLIFAADDKQKEIYNIYVKQVGDDPDKEPSLLLAAPYSLRYLSWRQ